MSDDADDPLSNVVPLAAPPRAAPRDDPPPQPPSGGDGFDAGHLAEASRLPLNDYGNGCRFALHWGKDCVHVPRVGWYLWDGARWAHDPDSIAIRRLAQRLGPAIAAEVAHLSPGRALAPRVQERRDAEARLAELAGADGDDAAAERETLEARVRVLDKLLGDHDGTVGQRLRHAKNAGNSAPMVNALREAEVGLSRRLSELDADPLAVCCASGVLRFSVTGGPGEGYSRTADLRLDRHDRAGLMTKMVPAGWAPNAPRPRFEAFLERVQPDPAMRAFLQRWYGLNLTALTGDQKLVFHYGAGANGKSVLTELMARLMGDYAAKAKIESLTGRNRRGGGDATPDLVPLIGARSVRAAEPDEGVMLQEGLIKELTGGETILVRSLHADFVEVTPVFKLTISGNHKPEIRGTDDGIWRRLLLVPWDVQIPPDERDPALLEKLWAERDGIFQWVAEGLLDYLENGLGEPDAVLDATRGYREESDPVGTFLSQACVITGAAEDSIPARELGEAFNFWLSDRGEGEWRPKTVAMRLKAKAGKWRSPVTGQAFWARKASTMAYDGLRFTDAFGRAFRDAPRDQQGRLLHGRRASDD